MIRRTLLPALSIALIIGFTNCSSDKKGKPVDNLAQSKLEKEDVEQTVQEIIYPLPTSFEVTNMINTIEASYILDLANPISNADKYFTAKEQALNLGVYSADLSYASTYNMKQDVMNLMEVSEQLIKEMNITGAFSAEFIKEAEANIDNREILTKLITNSFFETYEYLVKHDKEDLSLLVLVGSWVEALYISCNISQTVYENPEIVKIILHQKSSLTKLIDLLIPHLDHKSIQEILIDLKAIKSTYDEIEETSITEKQLNQVIEQTKSLRNKITS